MRMQKERNEFELKREEISKVYRSTFYFCNMLINNKIK